MKRIHFIILCAGIVATSILFVFLYFSGSSLVLLVAGEPNTSAPSGAGILGNRLPYFDLPTLSGNHIRSADFTDTPLVIMFWATWNAQSADELHILDQALANKSSQNVVKVVAIDSQEEKSLVSSFIHRGGYQVPTLLDTQGLTSERYGLKSLPTFYFVDRTGVVREIHSGMLNQSALMNTIEKIVQ